MCLGLVCLYSRCKQSVHRQSRMFVHNLRDFRSKTNNNSNNTNRYPSKRIDSPSAVYGSPLAKSVELASLAGRSMLGNASTHTNVYRTDVPADLRQFRRTGIHITLSKRLPKVIHLMEQWVNIPKRNVSEFVCENQTLQTRFRLCSYSKLRFIHHAVHVWKNSAHKHELDNQQQDWLLLQSSQHSRYNANKKQN